MIDEKLKKARELVKKKPYLVWYTKSYDKLSIRSILEAVLNSGDWDDFLKLEKIFGIRNLQSVFEDIKGGKRINLRPQTMNYFDKYFNRYAQRSTD